MSDMKQETREGSQWPQELVNLDGTMGRMEEALGQELLDVALQQIVARFQGNDELKDYRFTSYQLDAGLVYFNRMAEEIVLFMAGERKEEMKKTLDEMFAATLTKVWSDMTTTQERAKMKSFNGTEVFPGKITTQLLIIQAVNLLALVLAPAAGSTSEAFLAQHQESFVELLEKHVKKLGLGTGIYS